MRSPRRRRAGARALRRARQPHARARVARRCTLRAVEVREPATEPCARTCGPRPRAIAWRSIAGDAAAFAQGRAFRGRASCEGLRRRRPRSSPRRGEGCVEPIVGSRRARDLRLCDPATLARDLETLGSQGYAMDAARAFDMFPQTTARGVRGANDPGSACIARSCATDRGRHEVPVLRPLDNKVIDSRLSQGGEVTRRRRECEGCDASLHHLRARRAGAAAGGQEGRPARGLRSHEGPRRPAPRLRKAAGVERDARAPRRRHRARAGRDRRERGRRPRSSASEVMERAARPRSGGLRALRQRLSPLHKTSTSSWPRSRSSSRRPREDSAKPSQEPSRRPQRDGRR